MDSPTSTNRPIHSDVFFNSSKTNSTPRTIFPYKNSSSSKSLGYDEKKICETENKTYKQLNRLQKDEESSGEIQRRDQKSFRKIDIDTKEKKLVDLSPKKIDGLIGPLTPLKKNQGENLNSPINKNISAPTSTNDSVFSNILPNFFKNNSPSKSLGSETNSLSKSSRSGTNSPSETSSPSKSSRSGTNSPSGTSSLSKIIGNDNEISSPSKNSEQDKKKISKTESKTYQQLDKLQKKDQNDLEKTQKKDHKDLEKIQKRDQKELEKTQKRDQKNIKKKVADIGTKEIEKQFEEIIILKKYQEKNPNSPISKNIQQNLSSFKNSNGNENYEKEWAVKLMKLKNSGSIKQKHYHDLIELSPKNSRPDSPKMKSDTAQQDKNIYFKNLIAISGQMLHSEIIKLFDDFTSYKGIDRNDAYKEFIPLIKTFSKQADSDIESITSELLKRMCTETDYVTHPRNRYKDSDLRENLQEQLTTAIAMYEQVDDKSNHGHYRTALIQFFVLATRGLNTESEQIGFLKLLLSELPDKPKVEFFHAVLEGIAWQNIFPQTLAQLKYRNQILREFVEFRLALDKNLDKNYADSNAYIESILKVFSKIPTF